MNCIDLKQRFGKRYKIGVEESVEQPSRNIDPWYWEIPCRLGPKNWKSRIYPYGGEYLAVMVTSAIVANRMNGWPELEASQDAEDAMVFIFHVDHLPKTARAVRVRTRRQLSAESMKKIGANTAYRGKPQPTKQRSPADPTLSPSGDSEAIE